MKIHLQKEIEFLKKDILNLGSMVEAALRNTADALSDKDSTKAEKIIKNDTNIDRKEIEIEEECLKILALHQPVAADLRYVVACLKLNNELERIGDLVANIARRIVSIAEKETIESVVDFKPMMDVSRKMLRGALNSLIYMNAKQAVKVLKQDDIVDEYNSKMFTDLQNHIRVNSEQAEYFINLLNISRNLERIADCATNNAEDVIYMIEGNIVRHSKADTDK